MTLLLDINNKLTPEQVKSIESQKPVQGFCIMIDMCNFTAMKQEYSFQSWCMRTFNTLFMFHKYAFNGEFSALKVVGDCIMYFLEGDPDPSLANKIMNKIVTGSENFQPKYRSDVKVAAAYVEDIYNVSFISEQNTDYYGIGVDLTARMLSLKEIQKVAINDELYRLLLQSESRLYWKQTISEYKYDPEHMKGIDPKTKIYQCNIEYD